MSRCIDPLPIAFALLIDRRLNEPMMSMSKRQES